MKMYIENLLKRADLKSIEYFLRYGGENLSEKSDKPSAEQLRNAENNIADTLIASRIITITLPGRIKVIKLII